MSSRNTCECIRGSACRGEGKPDSDTAAGCCQSRDSNQGSGDSEPWAEGTGWPVLTGLGHPGRTPGTRLNISEFKDLIKAGHSSDSRVPMTQKNWVSKLQRATKEQVSQAQVTQVGLGSSTQEGEVPGKKTIGEAFAQVASQPHG